MHWYLKTEKIIYVYTNLHFLTKIVSGPNLPIVVVGICERTGGLLRGHPLLDGLRILKICKYTKSHKKFSMTVLEKAEYHL